MGTHFKQVFPSARVAFRSLSRILSAGLLMGLIGCGNDTVGSLPNIITLPTVFQTEGVAISGNTLFVGSIPSGRIFTADLVTGQGRVLVESIPARNAIGLKVVRIDKP